MHIVSTITLNGSTEIMVPKQVSADDINVNWSLGTFILIIFVSITIVSCALNADRTLELVMLIFPNFRIDFDRF